MKSVEETLAILSYMGFNPGCTIYDINKYILREINPKKTTSAVYRSFNELKREGYIKKHSHLLSKFVLTEKGWDFLSFYSNIPSNIIQYNYANVTVYIRIKTVKSFYFTKNRFYPGVELKSA